MAQIHVYQSKKDKVKTALKTFIFSCIKFHFKVYRDKREKEYRIRFQLRDFSTECKKCTELKSILSTLKIDMKDSYVFHCLRHTDMAVTIFSYSKAMQQLYFMGPKSSKIYYIL